MRSGQFTIALTAAAMVALTAGTAAAQEVVKIGMSFAMTGAGFAAGGRQASAGATAAPRHNRRGRGRDADAATPAAAGGFAAASALERRTRALGAYTGRSRAISASIF